MRKLIVEMWFQWAYRNIARDKLPFEGTAVIYPNADSTAWKGSSVLPPS